MNKRQAKKKYKKNLIKELKDLKRFIDKFIETKPLLNKEAKDE